MTYKKLTVSKVAEILGVSRGNLTFQIRNKIEPLGKIGYYCEPRPGLTRGQYVIYEEVVDDFVKNRRW